MFKEGKKSVYDKLNNFILEEVKNGENKFHEILKRKRREKRLCIAVQESTGLVIGVRGKI
jgi:hypothetical protein